MPIYRQPLPENAKCTHCGRPITVDTGTCLNMELPTNPYEDVCICKICWEEYKKRDIALRDEYFPTKFQKHDY
jgi:hypothetical protein